MANENELGWAEPWTYEVVRLSGAQQPSFTLDAVENNGLSPSLRRGAREGDFRDLCILTLHAGMRQSWKSCIRGAADWMYTNHPSPRVFYWRNPASR